MVHTQVNSPYLVYPTEKNIKVFMNSYRTNFPGSSVTPKFHLLEIHVFPFLRKCGLGFIRLHE